MRTPVAALIACALTASATPVLAQTPQAPAEPSTPPLLQLGPLDVRAALLLREVGWDSNVLNSTGDEQGDFTATAGGRLDFGLRARRLQGTSSTFYEYLYFDSFESERGANGGAEGRLDLLFGRFQPYVIGGIRQSHERPSAEIDTRAVRRVSHAGGGLMVETYGRTKLFAAYRRDAADYRDDERFRGVRLADELNGTIDTVTVGGELALTPLTTVAVHGERLQERFERSPDRDADSYRYGATVTFHPLALISGRASLGVRAFRPLAGDLDEFTGLTAAVALGYAFRDRMRIAVDVDRDLRHSFAERTPYYIATGGRVTLTHRLFGNVDGQVLAGLERLSYEARPSDPAGRNDRDRVRTVGGGVGYRLGGGSRVGLNFDHTTRSSPADDRNYSRDRLYANLTYGF